MMMLPMIAIPLTLVGGAQPLPTVPVHVNGKGPFVFVLDTGAGPTILSPQLAKDLGVVATGSKEGAGVGQRTTASLAKVDSIRVGEETARDFDVAITPEIERIAAVVNSHLDGVLGYSFLKHYAVIVDYPGGELRLARGHAEEGGIVIPFELAAPAKPLIVVSAMINGTGPHRLAVDTGASSTLIDSALAAKLGIASKKGDDITGAGGTLSMSIGRIDKLAIGAAETRDFPVAIGSLAALASALGTQLDGIVGYDFLKHYRVTIDYEGAKMVLR